MLAKRVISKIRRTLYPEDAFLRKVSGVIHVGANLGQERAHYARFRLDVVWIEPIPLGLRAIALQPGWFSQTLPEQ